ncbi:MAG: hypothetical protein KJ916_04000 [Alphaproteobacteria bacterium]|nr:hypothetical protein [Alphaproteobacteria bacterium]
MLVLLVAMLAGFTLSGQVANPQTGSPTTIPPAEAVPSSDEGAVTLECRRDGDRLKDCVIVSETPAGQGFGAAALSLARRARLHPRTVEQALPDAKIVYTTRFRLPD